METIILTLEVSGVGFTLSGLVVALLFDISVRLIPLGGLRLQALCACYFTVLSPNWGDFTLPTRLCIQERSSGHPPPEATMPRRLCATPQCGRGGRGRSGHSGLRGTMTEGYDSSVPRHLRDMLDDWEEEIVVQQLAGQRAQTHRKHYWSVKNMLAQVLLCSPGIPLESKSSPTSSPSTHTSSSEGPSLAPEPPKHQDPQQGKAPQEAQVMVGIGNTSVYKRKHVERQDLEGPSSFCKLVGLPTKEHKDNSSSAGTYCYPIIEEKPEDAASSRPLK
jgi:hypothetical protein